MKKVEVLYFAGCPNHESAVKLVRAVARELGVSVDLREVEVRNAEDAWRLRFLGSPSIRVEGVDIEPGARSSTAYAFACRTYGTGGLPPRALLAAALGGGRADGPGSAAVAVTGERGSGGGSTGGWAGAAVAAAVLASACCLGPLVLTAVGISALGVSAALEQARPWLLGVTVLFLGGAFYLAYLREPVCAPGSACAAPDPKRTRRTRTVLWLATVVVGLVALFPVYGGSLLRAGTPGVATGGGENAERVTLRVEGMSCEACAVSIEKELRKVPGVLAASVSYAAGQAVVTVDAQSPPPTVALVSAIEGAGYRARVETGGEQPPRADSREAGAP